MGRQLDGRRPEHGHSVTCSGDVRQQPAGLAETIVIAGVRPDGYERPKSVVRTDFETVR
jgi:hypothetical protein